MGDAQVDLTRPLYFSGSLPVPVGECAAGDFLAELQRRKDVQGTSDANTIRLASASLRNPAREWYCLLDGSKNAEDYARITTNWDSWKAEFCDRWQVSESGHIYSFNDLGPQRPGEEVMRYIQRIQAAVAASAGRNPPNTPLNIPPALHLTDAMVTGVREAVTARDVTVRRDRGNQVTMAVVRDGIRDRELANLCGELCHREVTYPEFLAAIVERIRGRQAAARARATNANANDGNGRHRTTVAAAAAEDTTLDDFDNPVAAPVSGGGRGGRGGGRGKGRGRGGKGNGNSRSGDCNGYGDKGDVQGRVRPTCTYCDEKGHTTARCFVKRFHEKRGSAAPPSGAAFSASADAVEANAATASGNGHGLWM